MRSAPSLARQVGHLRGVQVVRGRERARPRPSSSAAVSALAAFRLKSPMSAGCGLCGERVEQARRAHQDGAVAAEQEVDDALLAGLQHARAGHARREPGRADAIERGAQPVEVQVVERDARGAQGDRRVELLRRADQQVQVGRRPRFAPLRQRCQDREPAPLGAPLQAPAIGSFTARGSRLPPAASANSSTARLPQIVQQRARRERRPFRHPARRPPTRTACCPAGRIARPGTRP